MKKATKSTKSKTPAPAKKAVKAVTKAVKKAVVKVKKAVATKTAVKKTVVKKPVIKKTTIKKTVTKKPVKKAVISTVAKKPSITAKKTVTAKATKISISAKVDIGFGNTLFLRGEGKGLSWDQGVIMTCVADDEWSLTVAKSAQPRVFKFLINDQVWCTGEDYSLRSSQSGTFTPSF